ncbi:uncharacterized protein [Clytia hemisphaerica]|uniref:uncharacterized protein n=1 Tax=Clytia hemisphaerica TaxID=252671 RepID=UPI0034D47F17
MSEMQQIPRLINYPTHEHPLELTEGIKIYPQYNGSWKCDNCELDKTNGEKPYHCQPCQFDLCINCALPIRHLRHPSHQLYRANMKNVYPQYHGQWRCDGCDVTRGPELAYHCFHDQFDICDRCVQGQNLPIHQHPLKPVDAAKLYDNAPGWWACDCCKRHGTEIGSRFSWHCALCEFDCCVDSLAERKTPQHEHPVHLTDPMKVYGQNGSWSCRECRKQFTTENPEPNRGRPYHCFDCGYDICHECISPALHNDGGDIPMDPGLRATYAHNTPSARVTSRPHQPPTEILVDDDDDVNIENLDESERCVICCSRRKNATIVHGNTGHVCCCISCANTMQQRGDNCPICRAPIDLVIKQFNS